MLTDQQHQKLLANVAAKHTFKIYRERLNRLRYSRKHSNFIAYNVGKTDGNKDHHLLSELSESVKSQKHTKRKQKKESNINKKRVHKIQKILNLFNY